MLVELFLVFLKKQNKQHLLLVLFFFKKKKSDTYPIKGWRITPRHGFTGDGRRQKRKVIFKLRFKTAQISSQRNTFCGQKEFQGLDV